jgi:hypothetical protein
MGKNHGSEMIRFNYSEFLKYKYVANFAAFGIREFISLGK